MRQVTSPVLSLALTALGRAFGGGILLACLTSSASAHFLWQRIVRGPDREIELVFAESPDEPTSPDLLEKIAGARAWDGAGRTVALSNKSGRRIGASADDLVRAGASQTWGRVDRTGDGTGAFFLEYYAKGALTLADATERVKLPFELLARRGDDGQVVATLFHGELAVASAAVSVYLPTGAVLDRITDAAGEVRFEATEIGLYGVRARWIESRSGEVEGKPFGEVRHYSTLTFSIETPDRAYQTIEAAPAQPKAAEPAAYALLEGAHNARQVMPQDFPGFRCEIRFQEGERGWTGTLLYRRAGETELDMPGGDPADVTWVREQVLNLVGHRRGGDFAAGDGRYPLELAADDGNPNGRLVLVHDTTDSRYRIRDDKVLEVTRTMGDSRFTISVIETTQADPGKYLANHFLVSYRDIASGALQKVDGYRDSYAHIDGVWLPSSRVVLTVAEETSVRVRMIRLRNHARLEP